MALSKIQNNSFADNAVHGRRNLIINGAMQVAQRGTSSTSAGIYTTDRWGVYYGQGTITQNNSSLTSSDTPYDNGFRSYTRATVTSNSSSTAAFAQIEQRIEAQNMSQSGWNYTDATSKITLSFWARSSLSGTYFVQFRAQDGTAQSYTVSFTLTANTWKKITITIGGGSSVQIDNNNGEGLRVLIYPYLGTDYTGASEAVEDAWYARTQTNGYLPNFAQNWQNTASATFDVTGVQLEVGSTATEFEHRSYGEELVLCQRYFEVVSTGAGVNFIRAGTGVVYSNAELQSFVKFVTEKRATPTCTNTSGGETITCIGYNTSYSSQGNFELETHGLNTTTMYLIYDQTNGNSGTLPAAVAWLRGTEDTHANAEL